MAKRFSGDVCLTMSGGHMGYANEYDVQVTAPGCSPHEGVVVLQKEGHAERFGVEKSIDDAALQYLLFMAEFFPGYVKQAEKNGDEFHVSRS